MKRSIYTLLLLAVLSLPAYTAITATHNYLQTEQKQFAAAVILVRKQSYKMMLQAQADNDIQKLRYLRWVNDNAEKYVAERGANFILEKEKSH